MNTPLFPAGITGLSDTKWSGSQGNAHKLVGVDFRSTPGIIKAHQALKKISSTFAGEVETNIVDELCKVSIDLSDGTKLWFSSESGKIWQQTGDTFALVHTIDPTVDYNEPNSLVNGVVNDDDIDYAATLSIAENSAVYGTSELLSTNVLDASNGTENSLIDMGNYNVIAYSGVDQDGFIKTTTYSSTGSMTVEHTLEHDVSNGRYNSACKIDDTHFILAYQGGGSLTGFIKTFSVSAFYQSTQVASLEHDAASAQPTYNSLIKIDATHYALAYSGGASGHGYIKIFTIDGSYNITQTSTLTHDSSGATYGHKLVLVDATHLILSYANSSAAQIIKTFAIDGSWNVTQIDSETHVTAGGVYSSLIQLDATHYVWSGKDSTRGYMKVFALDGSYNITQVTSKDLFTTNEYASLLKNDENHIILASGTSTTGYMKVYSINSSYEIKELSTIDFNSLASKDTSILKDGRYITLVYSDSNNKNYSARLTISETYSNGIILNPAGDNKIQLIASSVISQTSMISQYLEDEIDIPENYSNLEVVVITAKGASSIPPVGATFAGVAMTEISNKQSALGFDAQLAFYGYKNPATGKSTIKVDFSQKTTYVSMIVLVFANVDQTTPVETTNDYGWKDYLTLPGDTDGQLRLGAFLTKVNSHSQGGFQDELASDNIAESSDRYTISVASRFFNIGTAKILSAAEFSYTQQEELATDTTQYKPRINFKKIYYANEYVLFAVPVDKISDWANNIETVGVFYNGDDTYHPMVKQNLELFIGDKIVIAKVDTSGNFIQETSFNVAEPERIQVLSTFDTDILIGTKDVNKARVLRWDTFSDSWLADDEVFENGINAFIKDDNFTYVSAGDYGRLYFYNGEKLNIQKRIPGIWDSTHKAIINENATGFYMGNPVFGLSNVTGNPTEQGIYGYGNYDTKYIKALSLDYPLPTDELSGVSIGSILVNGIDMYVSYKTATDVGVAKIDHSTKYANAYIETMMLTSLKKRNNESIVERISADYISLPTDTSITIGTKTKYDTNYVPQTVITDPVKMTVQTKSSTPKIVNLQIKFGLVSDGNNSPEIENLGIV